MIEKGLRIFLVLAVAWLAKLFIKLFLKRLRKIVGKSPLETVTQQQQRVKTLSSLLLNTSALIINTAAILLVAAELGINIVPLLTGVGILGLAVGFGAKSLVADFIAGFFILLENQFNIGDEVNLGTKLQGWQGRVIKISLRTTTLKDKEGKVYIIPNSQIKSVIKLPKE